MGDSNVLWVYLYSMKNDSVRVLQDALINWTDYDPGEMIVVVDGGEEDDCVTLGAGCSTEDARVDANFYLQRQAEYDTKVGQLVIVGHGSQLEDTPITPRTHVKPAQEPAVSSKVKLAEEEEEDDAWTRLSPQVKEALAPLFAKPDRICKI